MTQLTEEPVIPDHGPVEPQKLVWRGEHRFRVHTRAYTDQSIFSLEQQRIWRKNWVYLGHESEVSNPGNYMTTYIGDQPVIITRGRDGNLNAFYNRCRHRGALVCRDLKGTANFFRCPYHGWVYGNDGKLIGVAERDGYPEDFDQPEGLLRVPRVENFHGFIFGSSAPEGPSLESHLGLAGDWIQRRVAMSPVGELRVVSKPFVLTYKGNWKFQYENIIDEYHFAFVHESFMNLQAEYGARTGDFGAHVTGALADQQKRRHSGRRSIGSSTGHGLGERTVAPETLDGLLNGEDADYYHALLDLHGRDQLLLMLGGGSAMIFPNLGLIHRQIRTIRPLSTNETEVAIYPYEVVGAPESHNEGWLRSQERFYGAAGYGAPDDVEMFALNQDGLAAEAIHWLIMERGLHREEVSASGDVVGVVGDEAPLRALWRSWLSAMDPA
jgi:phenylpropionate dioxygenase-like ring-hydroxylating dioxygenase large terminal subunit